MRIDLVRVYYQIESPAVTAFFDLARIIPAFMKEAVRTCLQPRAGKAQQLIEGRKRTSGDDIGRPGQGKSLLDARTMDVGRRFQLRENRLQEGGFLAVAFDEMDLRLRTISQQDS